MGDKNLRPEQWVGFRRPALAGVVFATALAVAPAASGEEDDPAELPALTVTGTPPFELSTLSRAEIEVGGMRPITELLRQMPGVHLDRSGALGGVASLYLRGADPNYTAVLLDGVKVNDPTNTRGGSFDFATLLGTAVERIEVLSGPGSALLGADALAGAVNIVSRRGAGPPRLELGGGRGERGQQQVQAGLFGGQEHHDFALGIAQFESGGTSAHSSALIEQVHGHLGWAPNPSSDLRLTLRHGLSTLESFPEDSGGPRHAERRDRERRNVDDTIASLVYGTVDHEGRRYAAQLSTYRRNEDLRSPGVAPGRRDPIGIPAHLTDNLLARHTLRTRVGIPFTAAHLVAGLEFEREAGRSDAVFDFLGPFLPSLSLDPAPLPSVPGAADFRLARDTRAVFFDADLSAWGLLWEGSLRLEDPEGHDALLLPRVRLSYPRGPYILSVGGGRGFKLPSFFALGNPIVGNPDLLAEESVGADVMLERRFGEQGFLRVAIFGARYRNAIDFEEGPPPRLVNRTGVRTRGAELGFGWPLPGDWNWRLQVNYVHPEIENSEERLRNRPEWTGGSQLRWEPNSRWRVLVEGTHVGRQLDSSIPTGDLELSDYTRADLRLQWQVFPGLQVQAGVDNLLDRRYDEYVGFPGPRRHARLGLGVRL